MPTTFMVQQRASLYPQNDFVVTVCLFSQRNLERTDTAERSCFMDTDTQYANENKDWTKINSTLSIKQKKIVDDFTELIIPIRRKNSRPHAKLKCKWCDKFRLTTILDIWSSFLNRKRKTERKYVFFLFQVNAMVSF